MSNNTTEIDAIIDGCLQHYRSRWNAMHEYYDPNLPDLDRVEAKAKLQKLIVEARLDELRKVGLHHDEYYIQRLESLKGEL